MSEDMSPYCSAHDQWPGTMMPTMCQILVVTQLPIYFLNLIRNLQRRCSILLQSARGRVETAAKTAEFSFKCTIPSNGHTSLSTTLMCHAVVCSSL